MRKLKLDVEALHVDSFCATPADAARPGTVHGAMNIQTITGCEYTVPCQSDPDTMICTAACQTYGCVPPSGDTCFMCTFTCPTVEL